MANTNVAPIQKLHARGFYLNIDPFSSLHGIPSLFYREYKNFFDNTIILFDEHDNQVELRILRGESSAYIIDGMQNIIEIYGIGCGGSLKIIYVCRKFFYILSVRDDLMLRMVALKRNYKGYLHATVTDKGKDKLPDDEDQIFRSNVIAAFKKKKSKKISNLSNLPPSPDCNLMETEQSHQHAQSSQCNVVNNGNQVVQEIPLCTMESDQFIGSVIPIKFHDFFSKNFNEQVVFLPNHPLCDAALNRPTFFEFLPKPQPYQPSFVTHVCVLDVNDIGSGSLVLAPEFAKKAFPSQFDYVRLRQKGGYAYNMVLRWTNKEKSYYEVLMTRAWRAFVRNNLLSVGSKLKFMVSAEDERVMYAEIIKN
ncbi:hypothetical protein HN51_048568 [Arachis hypogaea]